MMFRPSLLVVALAALVLPGGVVSATPARIAAKVRLHRCGAETCVIVTGRRAASTDAVALAGHDVSVEGAKRWHADLPLETLRAWSAPSARTILVRVGGPQGAEMAARLPIGLLGHSVELAFLEVRAH